jgi:hypothetical protein
MFCSVICDVAILHRQEPGRFQVRKVVSRLAYCTIRVSMQLSQAALLLVAYNSTQLYV